MKEELRKIPRKNYVILGVVILVSLLIVYYLYMWFTAYKSTKEGEVILDKYMTVINYNELDDYLVENPDGIIYVGILNDEDITKFEKKFKNSIKNNKINKEVLYLNITDELNSGKKISEMKDKYTVNYANITDVPNIMVFEDGKIKTIYSIRDNGYDVQKVEKFINDIKIVHGGEIDD